MVNLTRDTAKTPEDFRRLSMGLTNEEIPDAPPGVKADDISFSVAVRAHSGTSMSPEQRGRREQVSYYRHMKAVWEEFQGRAKTETEREIAKGEFERYRSNWVGKYKEVLHSSSRLVSSMIAGPSKFPVARQQKLGRWHDNKLGAFIEWDTRAQKAAKEHIRPTPPRFISSDRDDAVEALQKKIDDGKRLQDRMKAANAIVRNKKLSDEEKLQRLSKEVLIPESRGIELVKPNYMGRVVGFETWQLSNNLANIKRMEERIKGISDIRESEPITQDFQGGQVYENAALNRMQIFFDSKPDQDMIKGLKQNGFKWSPREGAWQRQRNNAARLATERVLDIKLEDNEKPIIEPVQQTEDISAVEFKPLPEEQIQVVITRSAGKDMEEIAEEREQERQEKGEIIRQQRITILQAALERNRKQGNDDAVASLTADIERLGGVVSKPESEETPVKVINPFARRLANQAERLQLVIGGTFEPGNQDLRISKVTIEAALNGNPNSIARLQEQVKKGQAVQVLQDRLARVKRIRRSLGTLEGIQIQQSLMNAQSGINRLRNSKDLNLDSEGAESIRKSVESVLEKATIENIEIKKRKAERAGTVVSTHLLPPKKLTLSMFRKTRAYLINLDQSRIEARKGNKEKAGEHRAKALAILEEIPGRISTVNRIDDLFAGQGRKERLQREIRHIVKTPEQAQAVIDHLPGAFNALDPIVQAEMKRIAAIRTPKQAKGKKPQTPRGLAMDRRRAAKTIAPETPKTEGEKALVERWKNNPGRMDRKSYDTPGSTRIPTQKELDKGA